MSSARHRLDAITHLFREGTVSAINHEDERRRPGRIVLTFRVALGVVHHVIAQGAVDVVDILGDRSAVGGHAEQGFLVFISFRLVKIVGDLCAVNAR